MAEEKKRIKYGRGATGKVKKAIEDGRLRGYITLDDARKFIVSKEQKNKVSQAMASLCRSGYLEFHSRRIKDGRNIKVYKVIYTP